MLYNMLLNMLLVRQNYKALSSVARDHACHAHYLSTCGMSHPALLLIAAVLTATGRIAAATYRITLTHNGYYLYFTMRREMPSPPKKIAHFLGILALQPNTRSVPWPLPSPYKLTSGTSIDRFTRFVGLTFVTQTHADLATSATIGRILIPGYEALRRNNNKKKNNKILPQLLLTAGRVALDRCLLPAGATTANPPLAAAAGKQEECVTDTHRTVTSRGSVLGSGGTRPQIVARPQV